MSTKTELQRWLRQQVFRDRKVPLEKFQLRSALAGSRGGEVEDFPATGQVDINQLCEDITSRAQSDANSHGTKPRRYVILALEEGAENGQRFPMRLRGEGDEWEDQDGEEGPNEKGLVSQLMRHLEATQKTFVTGQAALVNGLVKRLDQSDSLIEKLIEQRHTDMSTIEASRSEQHLRDLQLMLASGEEERKANATKSLIGKVETLFPLIFNKLAGKTSLPEQDFSLVAPFIDSLTQEQIQHLARGLSHEQQITLLNIFTEVKKRKAAEAETPSSPNGQAPS